MGGFCRIQRLGSVLSGYCPMHTKQRYTTVCYCNAHYKVAFVSTFFVDVDWNVNSRILAVY